MKEIFRLSLPLTLWLVGFSAVYAILGLTCSRHWEIGVDAGPILFAASAVFVFIQAAALATVLYAPSPSQFVQKTAVMIAVTALIAAIWTALPVLATTACL